MKLAIVVCALALSGCGSTGVIPMDKGSYMVADTAAGRGFSTADGPKASVYRQANEFCAKSNRAVETINITSQDGTPFVRSGHAELQFRCIESSEKK